MKKRMFFVIVSVIYSSLLVALTDNDRQAQNQPANGSPASFPSCTQAFKHVYNGDLTVAQAQTQSWYTSYSLLYAQMNGTQRPDQKVTGLLSQLSQQSITADAATQQFSKLQQALIDSVNVLFSQQ